MPKGQYPRKKKISEMEQLDGKLYTDPNEVAATHKPRTLDEIMGIEPTSKYKITNTEEYETYLRDLNSTDLARECEKVGIVYHNDMVRTRKVLASEHARYFNTKAGGQSRSSIDVSKLDPTVAKILAEGR